MFFKGWSKAIAKPKSVLNKHSLVFWVCDGKLRRYFQRKGKIVVSRLLQECKNSEISLQSMANFSPPVK